MNIKTSEIFGLWLFILVSVARSNQETTYTCDPNASCGCSMNSAVLTRIVNGEDAGEDTWSWATVLYNNTNSDDPFFCGGSILTDRWIITAAHCLDSDASEISVGVGSNGRYTSTQKRNVTRIIPHPDYVAEEFVNDIGLIELAEPLDMSDPKIRRICVPHINSDILNDEKWPYPGTTVVVVGWGALFEGGPTSNTLLQVTLKILNDTDRTCARMDYDPMTAFCAGAPYSTQDACQGDSGGPIMVFSSNRQWILAGVVSYGEGCARPGYSGIYTRVSAFEDWLKSYVNDSIWITNPVPSTTQSTTTARSTSIAQSTITTTFPPIELQGNIVNISIYNIFIITLFNFIFAFYF